MVESHVTRYLGNRATDSFAVSHSASVSFHLHIYKTVNNSEVLVDAWSSSNGKSLGLNLRPAWTI